MGDIEVIRERYRPERIKILFVGESPPHSGAFFYCGNSAMLQHMQSVVELALGESDDFLKSFKAYGWYLDDLVLTPADRIASYQPEAIVSLLRVIEPFVKAAAEQAGSKAPRYAVPFPGVGHQNSFKVEMACIIPKLPRLTKQLE